MSTFQYIVRAETKKGLTISISKRYETREDAEGHRVRLADYKRVWVQTVHRYPVGPSEKAGKT